jgi:hypothetical protein
MSKKDGRASERVGCLNRRDFIKTGAAAAAGAAVAQPFSGLKLRAAAGRDGGRPKVVRVYDDRATFWDYSSTYYFDHVNQGVVDDMLEVGVKCLTNTFTVAEAWGAIMAAYQPGDKVAVKINLNNYAGMSNEMDAIAPSINALCHGLVDIKGIPAADIRVYDCSRPIHQQRVKDRVTYGVTYVESGDALAQADYDAPVTFRNISTQYIPLVVSQSQHLINLPLFKDHFYVLATMCFKNHLGTSKPGPSSLHPSIHTNLSDFYVNPHIRDKTRLVLGDALFGLYDGGPYGEPMPWDTFPNGPTPNSLFLSFDPVAHESVMIDYLLAEQAYHGVSETSHQYLHEAMDYHGLGVHEHRDAQGNYTNIWYIERDAHHGTDCWKGNVNKGVGLVPNVLFVNGSAGVNGGVVEVPAGQPIVITLDAPPSRSQSKFALYAWTRPPEACCHKTQPWNLGVTCLPTPMSGTPPQPVLIWNNFGYQSILGEPNRYAPQAPCTVANVAGGLPAGRVYTLQGIIQDDAAIHPQAAVTNAVVIKTV